MELWEAFLIQDSSEKCISRSIGLLDAERVFLKNLENQADVNKSLLKKWRSVCLCVLGFVPTGPT